MKDKDLKSRVDDLIRKYDQELKSLWEDCEDQNGHVPDTVYDQESRLREFLVDLKNLKTE